MASKCSPCLAKKVNHCLSVPYYVLQQFVSTSSPSITPFTPCICYLDTHHFMDTAFSKFDNTVPQLTKLKGLMFIFILYNNGSLIRCVLLKTLLGVQEEIIFTFY